LRPGKKGVVQFFRRRPWLEIRIKGQGRQGGGMGAGDAQWAADPSAKGYTCTHIPTTIK